MFKIIGLVSGLIAVRVIAPEIFHAFEHATVSFFHFASKVFEVAPNSVTQLGSVGIVNYIPPSAPLPASLTAY